QAIVDVALAHQMVSKFTSLVAIDKEISRRGEALQSIPIPTNLPKGMDVDLALGKDASRGFVVMFEDDQASEVVMVTGQRISRQDLVANSPVAVVGAEKIELTGQAKVGELLNDLPQTANGLWLKILFGLLFLFSGLILLMFVKKTALPPRS
ncbi:MAG: hypothetical protein V3R64_08550, partial [Sphingomonadales bacterium]